MNYILYTTLIGSLTLFNTYTNNDKPTRNEKIETLKAMAKGATISTTFAGSIWAGCALADRFPRTTGIITIATYGAWLGYSAYKDAKEKVEQAKKI